MAQGAIKRILVYTHNSIGLGHAFRTLAVLTGIKRLRPDIDFMVISGTSIPQVFFAEGIEVVKLPSIKLDIDRIGTPMSSRYFTGMQLESIFDFRQRIIMACFDFLQPDALIVEHNMTGQMSELLPLLMKKWVRKGSPVDFALAHLCRGIMRWSPILRIPYQNPRHRSESINIGALYDLMYVLEDREVVDINSEYLGNDPELAPKIHYLGKITNKTYDELPTRQAVLDRFGLHDQPYILISLGRNEHSGILCMRLIHALTAAGFAQRNRIVMIIDPYMDTNAANALKVDCEGHGVKLLPFIPDLVDLIRHAELVIARAGYNTVNEILLTGTPAMLIPESHGSGEQEQRAAALCEGFIRVVSEDDALKGRIEEPLRELHEGGRGTPVKFDKYAIGRRIIDDLEQWHASRYENGIPDR